MLQFIRFSISFKMKSKWMERQLISNCMYWNDPLSIPLSSNELISHHIDDENERKDAHVVMPACNLGCDILYEKGYIIVKDGTIKSNMVNKKSTKDLNKHIETIENSSCEYWNSNNQKYFESHEKKHT